MSLHLVDGRESRWSIGPLSPMLVGRGLGVANAFVSGLLALLAGLLMGFVVLLAAYLLAEYIASSRT